MIRKGEITFQWPEPGPNLSINMKVKCKDQYVALLLCNLLNTIRLHENVPGPCIFSAIMLPIKSRTFVSHKVV